MLSSGTCIDPQIISPCWHIATRHLCWWPSREFMMNDNNNLDSSDQAPAIERLRPNHVQGAKALIREVWREHFGSHPEVFVRDFLLLPHALDDVDEAAAGTHPRGLFLVQQLRGHVV